MMTKEEEEEVALLAPVRVGRIRCAACAICRAHGRA
jgi:hypothetical protein